MHIKSRLGETGGDLAGFRDVALKRKKEIKLNNLFLRFMGMVKITIRQYIHMALKPA